MEFDLIARHFTRAAPGAVLGVGDDCALLAPTPGMQLAVSSDMLLEGRHFSPQDRPGRTRPQVAGGEPVRPRRDGRDAALGDLSIALPEENDAWLTAFARGFFRIADQHGIELVGGDTTRGALTIAITAIGEVPTGPGAAAHGARAGDDVWVSGHLGAAALALAYRQGRLFMEQIDAARVLPALYLPTPRVALGIALRGIARSAIDISDGLLADLGHILEAPQVGADPGFCRTPDPCRSPAPTCTKRSRATACWPAATTTNCASPRQRNSAKRCSPPAWRAASASPESAPSAQASGLVVRGADGQPLQIGRTGYDHFDE
jgi:thiamine-monophosphate kinase